MPSNRLSHTADESHMCKILIAFYSGLQGRAFKAPRLRAVIEALRSKGFDPIFMGLPDTWEIIRWCGLVVSLRVLVGSLLLGACRKLGKPVSRRRHRAIIERAAIERLKRGDIKLVYTQKGFLNLLQRCSATKIPTIVEYSTTYKGERKQLNCENAAFIASRVVVFSDEQKIAMIQDGVPEHNIQSIWPVDSRVYCIRPPAACPDVPRFIYTSFFKKLKRLDMTLSAWAHRTLTVGELHIIGPIDAECEWIRSSYSSREDVVFWGYRDPYGLYRELRGVGLQLSAREGLPRAMLEYMEHGFPLLVSVEASKGFVEDGVEGRVLDPCNEKALRCAFDSILEDYGGFWELGRAGQRRLQASLGQGGFGQRVGNIVTELTASQSK